MWNTYNGQVCFPSGAFTVLLGHTVRELANTLCRECEGGFEWDMYNLFIATSYIVSEEPTDAEYIGFDEELCSAIDSIFTQLRENIICEINTASQFPEDASENRFEEYFWRTKLYEAYMEVSHDDGIYEVGDDDADWDGMLEYLRDVFGRIPEEMGDCFVDDTGEVYYLRIEQECRFENGNEDDEDREEYFQEERAKYYNQSDDFHHREDRSGNPAFPRFFSRTFRHAERDIECTRNMLVDLCDWLIEYGPQVRADNIVPKKIVPENIVPEKPIPSTVLENGFQYMITNDQFSLRKWNLADASSLVRHANNDNIARNLRDRFPHPYTQADAIAFLNAVTKKPDPACDFAIVIDGQAVGGVGIVPQTDVERISAEIGYWLSEEYWNRGVMTDVLKEMVRYVFKNFEVVKIFAPVFDFNIASMRVLEKANFRLEGILKHAAIKEGQIINLHYYGCVKTENEPCLTSMDDRKDAQHA